MLVQEDEADADGGVGGAVAGGGGGEVERVGEDRWDRDTRLSRASCPRVAGLDYGARSLLPSSSRAEVLPLGRLGLVGGRRERD